MREFIVDTIAYLSPPHAVEGLETADAERTVEGTNHSIAEIVAHIDFWQRWFIDRCEGVNAPMVGTAAEGWPSVPQGAWPEVRARFLEALERAAALGTNEAGLLGAARPADRVPAARGLHSARRARPRRHPQRSSPRPGDRAAPDAGDLAAARRQLDVVAPVRRAELQIPPPAAELELRATRSPIRAADAHTSVVGTPRNAP